MTFAGEARGTGAVGVEGGPAVAMAELEGTVRRSGMGGTGGTGPASAAGARAFGGVPTGLRMGTTLSAMPLVDWVAAPNGPEGLSIEGAVSARSAAGEGSTD